MANKILKEAVALRRAEFPVDSKLLSDWQVHSAHLVQLAILAKGDGGPYDAGPRYIPFPTGSGKTIGARWGIVNVAKAYPDSFLDHWYSGDITSRAAFSKHVKNHHDTR